MKTGREDYEGAGKQSAIHEREPTFILRAQDDGAQATIEFWCRWQLVHGAPPAVIEQALQQADRMAAWPIKKVVDADHLSPEQLAALEAAFAERKFGEDFGVVRAGDASQARHEGYEAGRRTGKRDALALAAEADRRAASLRAQLDEALKTIADLRGVVGSAPTPDDETAYLDFERGSVRA
jgi:hypothetical protein